MRNMVFNTIITSLTTCALLITNGLKFSMVLGCISLLVLAIMLIYEVSHDFIRIKNYEWKHKKGNTDEECN